MPAEYSKSIPSMFARVYTAPPQEIFFDMYENDASFDEAAKNLYDQELEQGFDTASLDEFLEPSIEDFDDAAVEKAIYQTAIAQEQGRNPTEITTTPYGAGLLQDEYDEVMDIYPGIGAGMEWRTMDDHYHDAQDVLNHPRAGAAIDHMVDAAVSRAEDEGAIDSLGDVFRAFGEQLGRAAQNPSEIHVASRTEVDPDTGDLFLGPSIGPNTPGDVSEAAGDTAEEIANNMNAGLTTQQPGGPEMYRKVIIDEETGWLLQDPDDDNEGEKIIRGFVDRDFSYDDAKTAGENNAEMRGWNKGSFRTGLNQLVNWIGNIGLPNISGPFGGGRGGGKEDKDLALYIEQFDVILTKIEQTEPDKVIAEILNDLYKLSIPEEGEAQDAESVNDFSEAVLKWVQDKGWAGKLEDRLSGAGIEKLENRIKIDLGEDGAGIAGWVGTGTEELATTAELNRSLGINDLMKKNEGWDRATAEEHWDKMNPEEQTAYAEEADLGAPSEEEMRTRHNRALSRSFYEVMYAQPWGGKAEFASIYPTLHSETKTLFFIEYALGGIDGIKERYGQTPPTEKDPGAEYQAGDDYKKFLRRYLRNPDTLRKGTWLAGRIKLINDLLQKKRVDPYELTKEERTGGTWTTTDKANWAWIQPLFAGETQVAKTNRYNLIAMVASRGQQGYMANIIKAGAMRAIQHYENMGLSDSEIFTMYTKIFGDTGGKSRKTTDEVQYPEQTEGVVNGDRLDTEPTDTEFPDDPTEDLAPGVTTEGIDADSILDTEPTDTEFPEDPTKGLGPGVITEGIDADSILDTEPTGPEFPDDPTKDLAPGVITEGIDKDSPLIDTGRSSEDIEADANYFDELMQINQEARERLQGDVDTIRARGLAPTMAQPGRMGGVSATLTDDDIADILAEFDMRMPLPKKKKKRQLSPYELDDMMIDFGM